MKAMKSKLGLGQIEVADVVVGCTVGSNFLRRRKKGANIPNVQRDVKIFNITTIITGSDGGKYGDAVINNQKVGVWKPHGETQWYLYKDASGEKKYTYQINKNAEKLRNRLDE